MVETTKKTEVKTGVKVGAVYVAINKEQLVNLLFGVKGVTFIGAETSTIPSMNLGGRNHDNYMYDNVVKDSTINCMLGFDYETRRDTLEAGKWLKDTIDAARAAGIDEDTIKRSIGTLKEHSKQDIKKYEAKERKWGKPMKNTYTGISSRIMIHHTKKDKDGNLLPQTYKRYMQVEILTAKSPVYRYKDSGEELSAIDLETVKKYLKKSAPDDLVIRDYTIENIKTIHINKGKYRIKS